MEEDEEAGAGAVARGVVGGGPEAGPLAEAVGGGGEAADGDVDAEVDFDGGGVLRGWEADGGNFAEEDDGGVVGELVEGFFYGGGGGCWVG